MKVSNYSLYSYSFYDQGICNLPNGFKLGDIVFRMPDILCDEKPEIGVVIQVHSDGEYRTDNWGNFCLGDLFTLATKEQIEKFRATLLEVNKQVVLIDAPISNRMWNKGESAIISNELIRIGGNWFKFDSRYVVEYF